MSEEQTIPGTHLKRRATSRLLLALLLLFVVWVVITTTAMRYNGSLLVTLAGLSGLVLMSLILASRGWDFHEEAFDHLASHWQEVSRERDNFKAAAKGYMEEYDRALQFIRCFRPTQEVVDEILRRSAKEVREAYEHEVKLQMRGVADTLSSADSALNVFDLEEQARAMANQFEHQKEKANTATKEALRIFWVFWNLADKQGYTLKKSWKPYAGLPWQEKS